jgi:hypothetical protein
MAAESIPITSNTGIEDRTAPFCYGAVRFLLFEVLQGRVLKILEQIARLQSRSITQGSERGNNSR